MTIDPLDPGARSDGILDHGSTHVRADPRNRAATGSVGCCPAQPANAKVEARNPWRHDDDISWYGPGLYGNGTACGQTLTKAPRRRRPSDAAVRHPHRVPQRAAAAAVRPPVVDRGPYVTRPDLGPVARPVRKLNHCYTGTIHWRYGQAG